MLFAANVTGTKRLSRKL